MNNWLVGFSEPKKTDEDFLRESIERYSAPELNELMWDVDPYSRPTHIDDMREKIATASRQGRELAREHGELNKIAFLPALMAGAARLAPIAGRVLAGGGAKSIATGVAKDMAVSAVGNKVMGALKPQASNTAAAAGQMGGGFKYAGLSGLMSAAGKSGGGLLQRAAGHVVNHPGTALTAAGAVGGAALAPRDEQGNKQYLRGAVMGGAAAAGANALSGGSFANKLRAGVMKPNNPALGQSTRQYFMDAAAAGKGKTPVSSSLRSKQTQYGKATPATSGPTTTPSATPGPVASQEVPAQAAAPSMNAGQQAAQDAVKAGIKVPANMLHPDASLNMGGGVRAGAGQAGEQMVQRPSFFARAGQWLGNKMPGQSGTPAMGTIKVAHNWEKIAEQMFVNMSPAQRILFVAEIDFFEKKANQQSLKYDPATKTFQRLQHGTTPPVR